MHGATHACDPCMRPMHVSGPARDPTRRLLPPVRCIRRASHRRSPRPVTPRRRTAGTEVHQALRCPQHRPLWIRARRT
jgi:hypothetical protein